MFIAHGLGMAMDPSINACSSGYMGGPVQQVERVGEIPRLPVVYHEAPNLGGLRCISGEHERRSGSKRVLLALMALDNL